LRLTGLELPISEMAAILERLGFELAVVAGNSNEVVVKVPSFRPDIAGKADLVEEIVRIAGLDRIVPQPLPRAPEVTGRTLTPLQKRARTARRTLAAAGLVEAVSFSFVSHEAAQAFGGGGEALSLLNPIAADLSDMRPSLLPGLVGAAQRNADRGFGDLALFEVGPVFLGTAETQQKLAAAAIRRGAAKPSGTGRHWQGGATRVDVFDAKADMLALLSALGITASQAQLDATGPAWFHPGRCGTLRLGPKIALGHFGELHPAVLEAMKAQGPIVAFELHLDDIPAPKSKATKAKGRLELSEFMPVQRDFAFLADVQIAAGDLVRAAQGADRMLITDVGVFDLFEGAGIPTGKKSIAIAVTLQPRERTLTETDIDAVAKKIIMEVGRKTGATLRG
jgi:phenylalanyl-tRNA synthetase beta chain